MEFKDLVKSRRLELNLTLEEIGKYVGVSKATVQRWESGEIANVRRDKIYKLSKILQTTPAYLMGWEESADKTFSSNGTISFDNVFPVELKRFPMLGEIACGEPIFADEDRESYVLAGIDIKADFCLRCRGDSMIGARILDGDIVFIRRQDMVRNGEIAAVIIDDEATLKRVSYFPEKKMLILKPENPKYEDKIFMGDELNNIRILGRAIAFQSDVI